MATENTENESKKEDNPNGSFLTLKNKNWTDSPVEIQLSNKNAHKIQETPEPEVTKASDFVEKPVDIKLEPPKKPVKDPKVNIEK